MGWVMIYITKALLSFNNTAQGAVAPKWKEVAGTLSGATHFTQLSPGTLLWGHLLHGLGQAATAWQRPCSSHGQRTCVAWALWCWIWLAVPVGA